MLEILEDSSFFQLLQSFDRDICNSMQAKGCQLCGGNLDAGHYQRKPRGLEWAALNIDSRLRFSLCCRIDGCRKRSTPLSLRFADRKVYCSLFIMLFALVHERGDERAQKHLFARFGLSRTTSSRWLALLKANLKQSEWARGMQTLGVFGDRQRPMLSSYFDSITQEKSLRNQWVKVLDGIKTLWAQLV